MAQDQARWARINANATTVLASRGGGILKRLVLNQPGTTWTIEIRDGSDVIGIVTHNAPIDLEYNVQYGNGLSIVTAGTAGDLTVVYT